MDATLHKEEFLKNVEDGHQSVYPEDPQEENANIGVPLILGSIIGFLLIAGYLILGNPVLVEISVLLLMGPFLTGCVITLGLAKKVSDKEGEYGVRGINRKLLSQAIYFLDMISQGEAEVGKIVDDKKPQEQAATTSFAFGAAIYVLKKIDAEMAKMWLSSLQEKLRPETSFKSIWLLRITIYGTFIIIPLVVVLEILRAVGIVSTDVAFPLMISLIGIMLFFIVILSIYAMMSSRADVPDGVRLAISEPQVRFDTERALEKLIQVIKTEGKNPLRVLVLGEHEELTYTNRVYTTSKGYTLRAAVLFPEELLLF